MKSYLKIYGPPVLKAIKVLEAIAVDMPEVCIMDTIIASTTYPTWGGADIARYFSLGEEVTAERCGNLISKSGEDMGEYDFYFEWFKNPTPAELNQLIEKIDEALTPLGCNYTITTK